MLIRDSEKDGGFANVFVYHAWTKDYVRKTKSTAQPAPDNLNAKSKERGAQKQHWKVRFWSYSLSQSLIVTACRWILTIFTQPLSFPSAARLVATLFSFGYLMVNLREAMCKKKQFEMCSFSHVSHMQPIGICGSMPCECTRKPTTCIQRRTSTASFSKSFNTRQLCQKSDQIFRLAAQGCSQRQANTSWSCQSTFPRRIKFKYQQCPHTYFPYCMLWPGVWDLIVCDGLQARNSCAFIPCVCEMWQSKCCGS